MEVSQAQQGTGKVKPVRPRPRPRPGIGQGRPTNLSGPPRVDGEDLESPFLDVDCCRDCPVSRCVVLLIVVLILDSPTLAYVGLY